MEFVQYIHNILLLFIRENFLFQFFTKIGVKKLYEQFGFS